MWRSDGSTSTGAIGCLVAVLAALALAGCGGNGGGGEEAATATTRTTEETTTDETTTEEEPAEEPITAAEQRWAREVARYVRRAEQVFGGGVITKASIRSEIAVFEGCRPMLKRAGDPGRFARAETGVRRACDRFERAARALHRVLDAGGPSAVVGTPEEKVITAGIDTSIEAGGNGYNLLMRARDQIGQIRAGLPR